MTGHALFIRQRLHVGGCQLSSDHAAGYKFRIKKKENEDTYSE
jgi:hypothetical protein